MLGHYGYFTEWWAWMVIGVVMLIAVVICIRICCDFQRICCCKESKNDRMNKSYQSDEIFDCQEDYESGESCDEYYENHQQSCE